MTAPRLRLAFAGTPEIACRILESILEHDQHDVSLVLTQPDRPAGRGRKLKPSEVKLCALENNIPIEQPAKASELDPALLADVDLMLVIAYGIVLKQEILSAPRLGCINIHTSLLPRWRGAAPIQRTIEAGDNKSGISIMQMDAGLDTGPILLQRECDVSAEDTAGTLHDRLVDLSIESIHDLLNDLAEGNISAVAQDDSQVCYANKISKAEAELDWQQPALVLEQKIRAFNPFPIAHTILQEQPMRVWQASIKPHQQGKAGTIYQVDNNSIDVITADGILAIEKLQIPGKRILTVREFLNGRPDFYS